MRISVKCPKCGSEIITDTDRSYFFCTLCGERISFENNNTANSMFEGDKKVAYSASIAPYVNVQSYPEQTVLKQENTVDKAPLWTMVFGIVAFLIAIGDWFVDPWWLNVVLALIVIALSIVSLAKKFRFKGFSIAAIPIAAIAGIIGIISIYVGPNGKVFSSFNKNTNYWDVPIEKVSEDEKLTFGGISFTVPGEFGEKENDSTKDWTKWYSYDPADDVGLVIGYLTPVNIYGQYDSLTDFYFDMSAALTPEDIEAPGHVIRKSGTDCFEWEFTSVDNTDDISNIELYHKLFAAYNDSTNSLIMIGLNEAADRSNSYVDLYNELIDSIKIPDSTHSSASGSSYSSGSSSNAVTPSLKKTLDKFEEFADYYVKVMNAYNSGEGDYFELLNDYLECLEKLEEFTEMADKLEQESSTFSDADLAYYMEVMTRVYAKLGLVGN